MKIFMVLFLFCGPILAQEKTEIPTGNPFSSVLTVPKTRSLGPVIEIIELGLNNTVGEAIEIVRQAALKEDRFFAFSVSLHKHELAAPFEGSMTLKKVPAFVALNYICDSCRLDYVYEGGMWRIHPASWEEGQDERQMLIRDITEAEYKALGLRFDKEKLVLRKA
jgi:hypothetical protein